MRITRRGRSLLISAILGGGCDVFDVDAMEEKTDGSVCTDDDDCSTGVCTSENLCAHSQCRCSSKACPAEGEPVPACPTDWVCVDYDSIFDPVVEFFGGTPTANRGYCQLPCDAGCPEHYACDGRGQFCKPIVGWSYPRATIRWSVPEAGEVSGREAMDRRVVAGGTSIDLEGHAESPVDAAITVLQWTTTTHEGVQTEHDGERIFVDVPEGIGSWIRVELMVADDGHRSGSATVVFETCVGTGGTCGYQGSGCCNGCDQQTNTCS